MKNTVILLLIVLTVSIIGLQSAVAAKNGPPSGAISEVYILGEEVDELSDHEPFCGEYEESDPDFDERQLCVLATSIPAATSMCALTGFALLTDNGALTNSISCAAEVSTDGTYHFVMRWLGTFDPNFEPAYGWCEFKCMVW